MASNTFHRFLDLPWELRRQIWEHAVHPIGHGIHTFSFLHREGTNHKNTNRPSKALPSYYSCLPEYFAIVPELEDNGKPNKSAYLWDAGLWTACKESRDVMMTEFDMAYWYEKRRGLVGGFWGYIPDFVDEGDHPFLPAITIAPSIQDGGEDWHLLVRPGQDGIKFTLESLQKFESEFNWSTFIFDLPFSNVLQGCDPIKHIVLDFESNWCRNGDGLDSSDYECAASRFLYSVIMDASYNTANPIIWLIDRGTYREDPYFYLQHDEAMVFYDCDDEYVETEYRNPFTKERSAAYFVCELGRVGDEIWSRYSHHDLHERNFIRILRPKKLINSLQ